MAFNLEAPPGTDIWRKPPSTNIWNAPISHTNTGPLKKFLSARVTFWADWTERYDQAGLLLVPRRASAPPPTSTGPAPDKWIKTGLEYYQSRPQLSTVGCDRFADWSVVPLVLTAGEADPGAGTGLTIEIAREGDEHGKSLWVYRLVLGSGGEVAERIPLREICWVLADEDDETAGEWLLDVGPLVARPEKVAAAPLKVEFKSFEVQWAS
ncbi:hypothetical protein GGS23DRAFT_589601 [Durotheca rogersii]|uniref:uncharacterized protein n=1 Tax=Durotheca rogersii TaxID=419775 RepID=UPI0022203911|nr:uncharacterized protein GGS23DRAFT_589601 [Durotheca rogersii]KAI5855614.1 hypothetical protein GGS23DRAFT_589601 [Durotheca rogersii]